MKKLILTFLLISLAPSVSSAYESVLTPLGSKYNPINVTVTEDPIQKASRESKEAMDALNQTMNRSVVNIPACASTYKAIQDYKSEIYRMGTSNPSTANTARNYLEYLYGRHNSCVSNAVSQQSITPVQPPKPTTPPSTDNQSFQEQLCKSIGPNVIFNGLYCTCMNGYVMSADNKTCVVSKSTKTNDQVCQDSYGIYSNWDGTKNNSGGLNCGCKSGYSWNSGQTACVYAPPKTNEEICQSTYGINSTLWIISENTGKPICKCKEGYEWTIDKKSCTVATSYSSVNSGGSSGGSSAIVPKTNPVQKVEKQEPAKKVIPEEKKPEAIKTEAKSTPVIDPYGENWQTKVVRWIVNLFR